MILRRYKFSPSLLLSFLLVSSYFNRVVIHYRLGDTTTELLKLKVRHNEKYIGYQKFQNMSNDYFIDQKTKFVNAKKDARKYVPA